MGYLKLVLKYVSYHNFRNEPSKVIRVSLNVVHFTELHFGSLSSVKTEEKSTEFLEFE